jgi:hypothetical protein
MRGLADGLRAEVLGLKAITLAKQGITYSIEQGERHEL